jgi:hypothetical protein
MLVKTVKVDTYFFQTVGYVYNRYRLGHQWVPAMVLNVQSDFRELISSQGLK